jgi:hypothetical protein
MLSANLACFLRLLLIFYRCNAMRYSSTQLVIIFFAFIIWTLRSALYEPVVTGQPVLVDAKQMQKNPSKTTNNTESTNRLMEAETESEPDPTLEIGAIV